MRISLSKGWEDNMARLLKFEFRKIITQKSLYICTLIMIGLLFLSELLTKATQNMFPEFADKYISSGIVSTVSALSNSSFSLVIRIFIAITVCEDYEHLIVKNIYSRGYSRIKVSIAKLITVAIIASGMFLIVMASSFSFGTMFFGVGSPGNFKFLALIAVQFLAMLAEASLYFAISIVVRKTGTAIGVTIVGPMLAGVMLSILDAILELKAFSLSGFFPTTFVSDLSYLIVDTGRIIECLVASIIYIPLFALAGIFINSRIDM
jgi:ABC-type transport system involved in multi-copper enzyme maturation permease subunit